MNDEINVDPNRKNPLVEEDEISIDKEILKEAEEETLINIPNDYIPITLPSNGRILGVPKILHFRDYSISESLEINTPIKEEKPKAISNVLTRMCHEKFDIGKLPIQDILYILYSIQATFISNSITKYIYVDETLPNGYEKGHLDNESNMEEVTIPINGLTFKFLGKDDDDKNLKENVRIPFRIKDTKSNKIVGFKLASLEDTILARNYCKNLYREELLQFSSIRTKIDSINNIKDNEKRIKTKDEYMVTNYEDCIDYYMFMQKYDNMIAQVIQALQIDSYMGKKISDISEKWDIYSTQITKGIWDKYLQSISKYSFGINNKVEVFSNKLNKKVVRTIGFQLSDFLSTDKPKDSDRYDVLFD